MYVEDTLMPGIPGQYSKMSSFHPNECFVCKKRASLKRCSRCNMISYCGEDHQIRNWTLHKDFCKVISIILKKNNRSHIYVLRGCNLLNWINARENMIRLVSSLLGRELADHEKSMLRLPRACFVCYDTRQNNLTNCPGCPLVSFCKDHPRSSHHDEMCSKIEINHNFEAGFDGINFRYSLALHSIMNSTAMESSNSPTSIAEYLDQNLNPQFKLDMIKIFLSTLFCIPLTFFNALQKLNYAPSSKLTIHVLGELDINNDVGWEILLHIFPNLINLTIVFISSDENSFERVPLCFVCTLKQKELILIKISVENIQKFLTEKDGNLMPNLVACIDLNPAHKVYLPCNCWKELLKIVTELNCPLVLTTATEKKAKCLAENANSALRKSLICFEGYNNFGSMDANLDWEEWEIGKSCQYMLVIKAPNCSIVEETIINPPEPIPKEIQETGKQSVLNTAKNPFYPGICHVCKSSNSSISCKRCKMIFYCGESHMKMDWPKHKAICNVIVGLLSEKGTPHLFDNMKSTSEESWLEAKLTFVKKAEFKLKRDLLDYEAQMFLFPKTCFVCHESDLSVLKTCKCGVSLCKSHRDDSRHRNLCADFFLDLQIGINIEIMEVLAEVTVPMSKKELNLPPSVESFINSYLLLKNESSNLLFLKFQKILVSEFLTRPLTFIYAVEKLKICVPETMVIHIIGAIDKEVHDVGYWRMVFYWLNNVKSLTIIFIGTKLSDKEEFYSENPLKFIDSSLINGKDLKVSVIVKRYDQFFESKFFSKPDMMVGYNLDLHKSNLGNSECNWENTLSIIKKINVPFLMTASSEERATKNNEMFLSVLPNIGNFEFCEKNPYGSLVPGRDFKTEGLCYSNNYLAIYKKFTKIENTMKTVSTTECQTKSEIANDKISPRRKNEVEMKRKEKKKVENSESGGSSKSEKAIGDKHSKLNLKKGELKVQITAKNLIREEDVNPKNEELIKENVFLQQEIKMLKENLYRMEENERLRNEIQKL